MKAQRLTADQKWRRLQRWLIVKRREYAALHPEQQSTYAYGQHEAFFMVTAKMSRLSRPQPRPERKRRG